jgi:RNA polymerase sigma-70 factor (ECF subfamily)
MRLRRNTSELDEAAAPPAPPASGERPLERSDLRAALADCMSRLPDAQREIVALRYRTAEASRAIASRLGIDKSTVNVRTFRALRALRECLTRRGFGAEDLP